MGNYLRLIAVAAGFMLLGGCMTYPYGAGFSACDAQAGACYRDCEYYAGEIGYGSCHAQCEREVNRCFDMAYGPYRSAGYASPWYGSHGAWYPSRGYVVSTVVIQNRYSRSSHRPSNRYDRHDRGRSGFQGGRRDDRRGYRSGGRSDDRRDGYRGGGRRGQDFDRRREAGQAPRPGQSARPGGSSRPRAAVPARPDPRGGPRSGSGSQGSNRAAPPSRPARKAAPAPAPATQPKAEPAPAARPSRGARDAPRGRRLGERENVPRDRD